MVFWGPVCFTLSQNVPVGVVCVVPDTLKMSIMYIFLTYIDFIFPLLKGNLTVLNFSLQEISAIV